MPLPTVHHRHRQSACGWAGQAEDDYRQERPRHRQVSHSRSVSCPSSVVVHGLRALCFLLVTEALYAQLTVSLFQQHALSKH